MLDIWRYTATQWGVDQAEAYEARFQQLFDFLVDNPAVGSIARYRGRIYRRWAISGHIVVFRQTREMLIIVRVLHGASDHRLYP